MSKEPYIYKQINGEESFLAEIVEAYTEAVLDEAIHQNYKFGFCVNLTSDVFGLGENNKLSFKESIRNRIEKKCFDCLFEEWLKQTLSNAEDAIENMIFTKTDLSFEEAIKKLIFTVTNDTSKIDSNISIYCRNLEWYLGKSKSVYTVEDKMNLLQAYDYIIFNSIFIEFDRYVLMLNIGTDD